MCSSDSHYCAFISESEISHAVSAILSRATKSQVGPQGKKKSPLANARHHRDFMLVPSILLLTLLATLWPCSMSVLARVGGGHKL